MESLENKRPSGLKAPSKIPFTAIRALQETTQSDQNARNATNGGAGSVMGPPGTLSSIIPSKHKVSGLPEPPMKRKTLAERAGEPSGSLRTKPSISNGFGTRPTTSGSNAYRTPSNMSSATGSLRGGRPPSRQANGFGLGSRTNSTYSTSSRAPPSQYDEEEDGDTGLSGSRKGTPILSFNSTLHLRKTRTHDDLRKHTQQQHDPQFQSAQAKSQHYGQHYPSIHDDSSDGSSVTTSRNSSASSMSAPPQHEQNTRGGPVGASQPSREVSLSTAFADLSLTPKPRTSSRHRPSLEPVKEERSPTKIPKSARVANTPLRHTQSAQQLRSPSPKKHNISIAGLRTPISVVKARRREAMPVFLTKEKLTPVKAWDTNGRLDDMERMFQKLKGEIDTANGAKDSIETSLEVFKARAAELEKEKNELKSELKSSLADLERTRSELHTTSSDLRQVRRDHERETLDVERKHERELADLRLKQEKQELQFERDRERSADKFRREMEEAKKTWQRQQSDKEADLTSQSWEEMAQLRAEHEKEKETMQKELDELRLAGESRATESASEVQQLRQTSADLQRQLEASKATEITLRSRIAASEARITALEQEKNSLVSKAHFLEGNQEAQSLEFTSMREKLEEALAAKEETLETLRKEETLRRKLNNTILELRGNIRVFVRTRPLLDGEEDPTKVDYVDEDSLEGCKEMVVHAPGAQSATREARLEKYSFSFDRVFAPGTPNAAVFEECRDLIQSVVDGYNVSVLSYGQTGSGKTYGMTGPDGIIPKAIHMLLSEMQRLKTKGWEYAVEANFVEVYNETINDLLGDAKSWDDGDDLGASVRGKKKEKHEIHHDRVTGKTTVTNATTVGLWPPPNDDGNWPPAAPTRESAAATIDGPGSYTEKAISNLLDTAAKNRRVAATKANERSSRSHSIFILTLKGSCADTKQSTEGVLNLVDLAGSERLKQSKADGSTLKETQAINKSLAALGDVIAALGNKGSGDAHVPYRNSKLTYLLQSSLGGTTAGKSSRTLMLLHLSPLLAHWQDTKTSLGFGTRVHGTHIGTAKKR
ncbi:Putative spindle pole body-associated Vik1/Cik1, microtubule binding protein [Septoria linicola]|uniref:Spindle pole body-associated Vik1/Cik1, microtubule binding protein n=1 Tax=Septoria linicola TaxID=215465 RepID=A0A9Q9AU32_9PEZI|nr:Putative spindle pole body-associated Vik1/Cik1, microtubule binding protein [Septoria linicola]